jgi:hypothetical protein
MRTSFLCRVAAGALAATLGSSAHAADDRFAAPTDVIAQADGTFQYAWKFFKGTGIATLGSASWVGIENIQGGLTGDCFCTPSCQLAEGDSITFTVSGRLQLPLLTGRVRNSISFCDSPGTESITRVLPYTTTGVGDAQGDPLSFRNGPNPFTSETVFHYVLPEEGEVALRIHDLSGRMVATLWEGVQTAGRHSVTWKARAGAATPAGTLFARLSHRGHVVSRAIVFLR